MKSYSFTFTHQEAATIARGLGELPFKISAPIIQKLATLMAEQDKPSIVPADKESIANGQSSA
jgi:hypothetical protein